MNQNLRDAYYPGELVGTAFQLALEPVFAWVGIYGVELRRVTRDSICCVVAVRAVHSVEKGVQET